MAMVEGLGSEVAALEGLVVAPAAGPTSDNREFREAFEAVEGRVPNDRATLVWEAMSRAWHGALTTAPARLWEVRGGALVQR